jgi:CRP-like cAMP-binding protein
METDEEKNVMTPRNQLLLALYRAQPGALSTHVREVTLAHGDPVFEEGAIPRTVVFPEGALLSSMAAMADGRMVEVASLGQGDAVGVLSCLTGEPETCRTVVRIGGPAKVIAAPVLKAAADAEDGVLRVLLHSIRTAAVRAEHELACNAVHDVTARLAKWLLLTRARTGEDRLALTQDDMAVILGVQRTTVNASALHLKATGAIRYSRGVVQVMDAARLEDSACECYAHACGDAEPGEGSRRVA